MEDNEKTLQLLTENYTKVQAIIAEQTATIFDHAKSYNNAVVTIGYASFFAIWAFTKESIPETVSTHVALAMGISILLFVIFVVIDMLFITYVTIKFHKDLRYEFNFKTLSEVIEQSNNHKENAMKFQSDVRKASIGILVIWPFFFLPSLFSGLYAGLLLIYNFLASLIYSLPYWPS